METEALRSLYIGVDGTTDFSIQSLSLEKMYLHYDKHRAWGKVDFQCPNVHTLALDGVRYFGGSSMLCFFTLRTLILSSCDVSE